jgi:hypothetical protein
VIADLIVATIGLILSIANVILNDTRAFNILHLTLIILSSVLALLDGICTLRKCESCRICCSKTKITPVDDVQDKDDTNLEDDTISEDFSKGHTSCKGDCYSHCENISDIARIVVTEMLVYPLLICDIFEVITEKGYEGKTPADRLGFALFILSCFSLVLYNYVARLLILAGMIKSVLDARTPTVDELWQWQEQSGYDSSIKTSALLFQIYFFVHVSLQMLAQVLMLVAIGGKIRYDNRHFYDSDANADESIHVSGYLWYMIVAGYFLPLMGFLTFFLVTYYWTQEFPVGLLVDLISTWKMGDQNEFVYCDKRLKVTKAMMLKEVNQFVRIKKLESEFHELRKTNSCEKFIYPFNAPVIVVIGVGYIALHLGFLICAAVALNDAGTLMGQILNGGGWGFFYIVAVITTVTANAYMFAVAALWIGVVTLIITVIALIIAAIAAAVALVVAFFILIIGGACLIGICASTAGSDEDRC